ncbi:MAG: ribose-phosphate pyrophosphokinase [Candidatus Schekmanbacteria bacterium]|nr:ribose-phosphate pyrophosphokinase [Candidatus Schekmanbacteria bacterium]
MYSHNTLKVFALTANPELGAEICTCLDAAPGGISVSEFADGELFIRLDENVRGTDAFAVQSTCRPANRNLMELLITIDTLKRASAGRITAVLPYYGYARQDKKDKPRVPISAKLVADLITAAGADRVLAVDLHANQIQGYFNLPVDHLFALPVFLDHLRSRSFDNLCVVSPDAGGTERARAFAKRLHVPLAIADKRRPQPNVAVITHIIGDVEGCDTLIVDDIVDTAGTLTETASALKKHGARRVFACCTHGVLSPPAIERINASAIDELLVTNTIPAPEVSSPRIHRLSVAALLADAIKRIHEESSVSSLFV